MNKYLGCYFSFYENYLNFALASIKPLNKVASDLLMHTLKFLFTYYISFFSI